MPSSASASRCATRMSRRERSRKRSSICWEWSALPAKRPGKLRGDRAQTFPANSRTRVSHYAVRRCYQTAGHTRPFSCFNDQQNPRCRRPCRNLSPAIASGVSGAAISARAASRCAAGRRRRGECTHLLRDGTKRRIFPRREEFEMDPVPGHRRRSSVSLSVASAGGPAHQRARHSRRADAGDGRLSDDGREPRRRAAGRRIRRRTSGTADCTVFSMARPP